MNRNFLAALTNAALVLASVVAAFLIVELVARVWYGNFRLVNFPKTEASLLKRGFPAQFSTHLGYRPRPGVYTDTPWKTTATIGDHGVRLHGAAAPAVSPTVLAVGDSFTFGSDVGDGDSWPARLQAASGLNVINGGVFGYGIDQAILRGERLAAVFVPDAVILGFIADDVQRAELSVMYGVAKPVFTIGEGGLERLNPVLDPVPQPAHWLARFTRDVFGYSIFLHHRFKQFFPQFWMSGMSSVRVHGHGVEVACALLQKFAAIAGPGKVLLVQYEQGEIAAPERPPPVMALLACVAALDVEVVDLYLALKEVYATDRAVFDAFYDRHMSARGNAFVAAELAKAETLRSLTAKR
jgi:hypothetical protein